MPTKKQSPTTSGQCSEKPPQTKVLPSATSQQEGLASTLQRVHLTPGTLTPREVLQLQRTIGNQAVTRLLSGSGTPAIQRKIKVRGGHVYGKNSVKKKGEPFGLRLAKEDDNPFLVNSQKALEALESNKLDNIFILPPAKHVIGEEHDKSQFEKAVENWGWGAERMVEELSSHPKVKRDERDAANVTDSQARPLENTVAKNLAILNYVLVTLQRVKIKRNVHEKHRLSDEEQERVTDSDARDLGRFIENLIAMKDSLVEYGGGRPGLLSRLSCCSAAPEDRKGKAIQALNDIEGKSKQLKDIQLKLGNAKEFGKVEPVFATLDAFQRIAEALVEVNLAIIAEDDPAIYKELAMDEQRSQFSKVSFTPTNPLREHYMVQNIRKLRSPALVRVGENHITGIRERIEKQPIPEVTYYENYGEFEEATRAETVLDKLSFY